MENYGLDPARFYMAPGLAWKACLKKTKICLELLLDLDMLFMFQRGIRGGIMQSGIRTITPRTITPQTITPRQIPLDNYPPRTNTPQTFTPPEKFFKHLPWYSLYLYSSYSFLLGRPKYPFYVSYHKPFADIRTAINGSRTSFRTTPTATLCSIFVGLPTTSACEEHFFSCFRLYATPKRLF